MSDRAKRRWAIGAVAAGCGCITVIGVVSIYLLSRAPVIDLFPATHTSTDEQTLRTALSIPPSATLVSLTADPVIGGTFGREGLRIVAVFDLTPGAYGAYEASRATTPHWSALPAPSDVFDFNQPPTELPRSAETGLFFCTTGVYVTGSTFTPHPCVPPPAHFDEYLAAILDESTKRLTVVSKHYY